MSALGNTHPTTHPEVVDFVERPHRVGTDTAISNFVHTDAVYNALMNATYQMEDRLKACRRTSSSCSTTCSSGTSRSPR